MKLTSHCTHNDGTFANDRRRVEGLQSGLTRYRISPLTAMSAGSWARDRLGSVRHPVSFIRGAVKGSSRRP